MKKNEIEVFKESLFKYDDYRSFLKDYFALQKKIMKTFTQRYFASKAGFSNHSFCNYVLNGKRNLSSKTIEKFAKAIELQGAKSKYFELLVNFNQTEEQKEKEFYFDEMQKLKKKSDFVSVNNDQSDYFSKRYYAIVRELVVNTNWSGDFSKLASMVIPQITTQQAQEAVVMMVTTGLLKEKDGVYTFGKENIDDSKTPVFLKKKARREVFETAVDSLDSMGPDQRFVAYSTFSADRESYEKINQLFLQFREQFNEIIMQSKNSEEVFQIVFGNFPVSKKQL